MEVEIFSEVPLEESLSDYVQKAVYTVLEVEELLVPGEVSVLIVEDKKMKQLNEEFRNIAKETDVLSFPQFDSVEDMRKEPYLILGDIVINMDRVITQAQELGHSLERELGYLVIHSMYHLLGYDHMEANEKSQMRAKEEFAYAKLEEK